MVEETMASKLTLADLKRGESGQIVSIVAPPQVRHRLFDLGLRRGEKVEMVRSAPLTDPLEFRVNNGSISLRRALAQWVEISKID